MAKRIVEQHITKLARTRPTMIITTVHDDGIVNAGTFGAYTNLGPSEIGIAIGTRSHTYQNIQRTGQFAINIPSIEHARALEICAQKIPTDESEVERAGLSVEPASQISAPIITECVVNIECRYWKETEIGRHSFVIAKTLCGHLDERYVDSDGALDVIAARVVYNVRYPEPLYAMLGDLTEISITAD